jgi:hypothetical protein
MNGANRPARYQRASKTCRGRFLPILFAITGVLSVLPVTAAGASTTLVISGAPTELGLPAGTTSTSTNGLPISPTTNPYGLTGTVQTNGTGSVNFTPAQVGNGVYLLNCCWDTNNAYYKFTGATLSNIFN